MWQRTCGRTLTGRARSIKVAIALTRLHSSSSGDAFFSRGAKWPLSPKTQKNTREQSKISMRLVMKSGRNTRAEERSPRRTFEESEQMFSDVSVSCILDACLLQLRGAGFLLVMRSVARSLCRCSRVSGLFLHALAMLFSLCSCRYPTTFLGGRCAASAPSGLPFGTPRWLAGLLLSL